MSILVTFDLNNSDMVDYSQVRNALALAGYSDKIVASSGATHELPYNTYVSQSSAGPNAAKSAYADVQKVLKTNGWTARALIAVEYSHAHFYGPEN